MSGSDLTFKTASGSLGSLSKFGNTVTYTLSPFTVQRSVLAPTLQKISSG